MLLFSCITELQNESLYRRTIGDTISRLVTDLSRKKQWIDNNTLHCEYSNHQKPLVSYKTSTNYKIKTQPNMIKAFQLQFIVSEPRHQFKFIVRTTKQNTQNDREVSQHGSRYITFSHHIIKYYCSLKKSMLQTVQTFTDFYT